MTNDEERESVIRGLHDLQEGRPLTYDTLGIYPRARDLIERNASLESALRLCHQLSSIFKKISEDTADQTESAERALGADLTMGLPK